MEFAKLINLNPNPRAPCSEHTVCYTVVLACFPTRQHNLLHFIPLRLECVDQLRSGFEESIGLPTFICIGFSFTAAWHEIYRPGLSRRFTCSVSAQDVFLAIFFEGFADVISMVLWPSRFYCTSTILYLRDMPLQPLGFNTLIKAND